MSVPTFAAQVMKQKSLPTNSNGVDCEKPEQFGDLTFVIGEKPYTIPNSEWVLYYSKSLV